MPDREKVIKELEEVQHYIKVENLPAHTLKAKLVIDDAIALLKAQEPAVAYWIPCNGKSHIWYCSGCGEKINYNDARRTYKTEKKPVEAVNRYCRGCGATMVQRPTDEQRKAVKWE